MKMIYKMLKTVLVDFWTSWCLGYAKFHIGQAPKVGCVRLWMCM